MLEDLHFAHFLILRNGGYETLETGVAVVHIVLQTEQVLLVHPAPGDVDAVLRQRVHGGRMTTSTAARRERVGGVLGVDGTNSLHLLVSGGKKKKAKQTVLGYARFCTDQKPEEVNTSRGQFLRHDGSEWKRCIEVWFIYRGERSGGRRHAAG